MPQVASDSDFFEVVMDDDTSSSVILPGAPFGKIIKTKDPVTDEEARRYQTVIPKFYVWGRIVYEDIYEREWITRFRFEYLDERFEGDGKMAFCAKGNEAS